VAAKLFYSISFGFPEPSILVTVGRVGVSEVLLPHVGSTNSPSLALFYVIGTPLHGVF
jgi:hypothetical protein